MIAFGNEFRTRVLIPACGRLVFEPGDPRSELGPSETTSPEADEIRYQIPMLPDAATIETLTITSERIWTGAFPTLPPCEGAPPSSTP